MLPEGELNKIVGNSSILILTLEFVSNLYIGYLEVTLAAFDKSPNKPDASKVKSAIGNILTSKYRFPSSEQEIQAMLEDVEKSRKLKKPK